MRPSCKRIAWRVALLAGIAVAGCGGGGGSSGSGDSAFSAGTGSAPEASVPTSALESVVALLAWGGIMVNTHDDTGSPLVLGDATLPRDDTAEPGPMP